MNLRRRILKRGRVEIIPMIDTIVILLIFYMTFSRFAELDHAAIILPDSWAGAPDESRAGQLTVNMYSSESIRIGGTNARVDDLPGLIRGYFGQIGQADPGLATKIKRGDVKPSIVLRGSAGMSYRDLSRFMMACAATDLCDFLPPGSPKGIAEVAFATKEGPRP